MSKDNDDQRIRQFLDLPSSELGYNLDSEDDDFDDPDYLPDTNDESNEQFINISDCELVFENSDILVTKTIDSVVNGKDSIDEPGPSSRPTTNQCKPPMRKRKACFRNPSNEKKRSNTKYPHIWKSAPSIKALTSAPKRARLSMALMFTGKAFHNRQAETVNDLLKVVVR
ncbi:hypothetical protein J6590_094132 [Homalodisca vitripennis]|nr:hypothetical protein J6590_094132 [Homalodisca vitripennis]